MSGAPESVWDYPRPPRVEPSDEHVEVMLGGVVIGNPIFEVLNRHAERRRSCTMISGSLSGLPR